MNILYLLVFFFFFFLLFLMGSEVEGQSKCVFNTLPYLDIFLNKYLYVVFLLNIDLFEVIPHLFISSTEHSGSSTDVFELRQRGLYFSNILLVIRGNQINMEIQHVSRHHHNYKIIQQHFVLVLEQDHHFCTESHQIYVAVQFPMHIMNHFHFWQATREKNKAFRGMLFTSMFQEKPITSSQQLQNSIQHVYVYHSLQHFQ